MAVLQCSSRISRSRMIACFYSKIDRPTFTFVAKTQAQFSDFYAPPVEKGAISVAFVRLFVCVCPSVRPSVRPSRT